MSEILLCKATRDELIEELKKRDSITHIQVSEDEGASLMSKTGKIAITGKAHVFVITENEKTGANDLSDMCKPLLDYINENYDPHTSVIVTYEGVKTVRDEEFLPI